MFRQQSEVALVQASTGVYTLRPGRTCVELDGQTYQFTGSIPAPHDYLHWVRQQLWQHFQFEPVRPFSDADEIAADYFEGVFKRCQYRAGKLLVPRRYVERPLWNMLDVSVLLLDFTSEQKQRVAGACGLPAEAVFPTYAGEFTRSALAADLCRTLAGETPSVPMEAVRSVLAERNTSLEELLRSAHNSRTALERALLVHSRKSSHHYEVECSGWSEQVYRTVEAHRRSHSRSGLAILPDLSRTDAKAALALQKDIAQQLQLANRRAIAADSRAHTKLAMAVASLNACCAYRFANEQTATAFLPEPETPDARYRLARAQEKR